MEFQAFSDIEKGLTLPQDPLWGNSKPGKWQSSHLGTACGMALSQVSIGGSGRLQRGFASILELKYVLGKVGGLREDLCTGEEGGSREDLHQF